MRRFSSEGSLLELDFLPWKRVALRSPDHQENRVSGSCRPHTEDDELDGGSARLAILEPEGGPGEAGRRELSRERSVSSENLDQHGGRNKSRLRMCVISGGCRAYSDGQLAPPPQGSTESVGREELPPPSPSSSSSHLFFRSRHDKPKVSSVRLHLRSLFGQNPSNPDLSSSEQRDGAKERLSRLLFMRQWSQVDHSRKRRVSLEELQDWAHSLNALLASQNGPSVFGAFLRSEFSEENLQFYLSCEQYRQSSSKFTLHLRARDICSTYIQPGAPREVNLDSKTRDLTMQLLQAPSHSSLSHAQKRIYSLLDTDCYPRFLQSSIYLSLLQEAAVDQEDH